MGKIVFSPDRVRSGPDPYSSLMHTSASEVARVTFSDSNSASLPKVLNPGPDPAPAIFQIWESDTCSTPAIIIDPTEIYPCFYLRNDHADSSYCRNWKVTPGPFFHKILTPCPDPVRKKNAESRRSWLRHSGSGAQPGGGAFGAFSPQ